MSAFPEEKIRADELSVISWVLPQTEDTRAAHRKAVVMPSVEWSKARHYGEKVNENLRRYVIDLFAADGIKLVLQFCFPSGRKPFLLNTDLLHHGLNVILPMFVGLVHLGCPMD